VGSYKKALGKKAEHKTAKKKIGVRFKD